MRLLTIVIAGYSALSLVSGISGKFQDSRETKLEEKVDSLNSRIERLVIDSVKHAKPVVVTIERVRDSIIIEKKTVKVPVMISLTGEDSDRIGRIEYLIIQKQKSDSFRADLNKRHFEIDARPGKKDLKNEF